MEKELRLMKGNEAFAEAVIRAGADGYFGYPITPQSEVMEYLMAEKPELRTGMVVLQAESEIASINMLYGGAGCGKKVLTSSSSPGISLMQEGLSYLAGAEFPCLIMNAARGGPGLGTIQPGQADYFQSVKGGGHGDYRIIVIAPASVQEMYDSAKTGFDLAFKYRTPVLVLTDGATGQMMEKVYIGKQYPRLTEEEIKEQYPWATTGKSGGRERNIITSLDLDAYKHEQHNHKLQKKYKVIEENEVVYEELNLEDADYAIVAYGTTSRICQKTMQIAREKGIKLGIFRLISLWPFPKKEIRELSKKVKGILCVEMSAGQMVEDVQLHSVDGAHIEHYGRMGGVIPSPVEIFEVFEKNYIKD